VNEIDDLKDAWRRRLAEGGQEPSRELARVRERAGALEAGVRRRDWIESGVALALLPVFAYFAVRAGDPVSRVGAAVVTLSCLLIPLRLRAARRRTPDPSLPVATFLRLQLDLVVSQRRLLLTVPLWYLAPLGVGVVLFVAGASPSPWLTAIYGAIVGVFLYRLYRLNRDAVTAQLEPRERELRLWIELVDEKPRDTEP
jgi:hypothetical protein